MFSKKSILARLLANENISVVQGNFTTASFNVETRQLQLPIWKEMSSDVYDLMVGHEVAHALWTPRENLAVEGVPFSFVNVVEDIRIEKLVLKKYPGLVSNFSRGYLDLIERDLFGTKDVDINTMAFMDRLNLKAKGRSHVDAEFSEEEKFYFDLAMSVETFEDVKIAVLKIAEWLSANQDENGLNEVISDSHYSPEGEESEQSETYRPSEEMSDLLDELSDSVESKESEQGSEESSDSEHESDQGSEESDSDEAESEQGSKESAGDESEKSKDTEEESEDLGTKNDNSSGPASLAEVSTDVAQQNNQVDLVDQSSFYVQPMDRAGFIGSFVPYSKVLELRRTHQAIQGVGVSLDLPEGRTYEEFLRESKPIVNMMVKEFEMRKTAYRTLRAKTSNKGTLDVNKLHSYKYDDHLFKQISTLADSKNHGMIMLIDFSGSMNCVLPAVIKQTINLVQFCKRVNIPFQVCAFTTNMSSSSRFSSRKTNTLSKFDYESLVLLELFNSKMSKSDFEYAMESFFARTKVWWNHSDIETLGSTPLNAALMATQFLIEDFKKTNRVEKLNLVTLTDGESDPFAIAQGSDYDHDVAKRNTHTIIKGERIDCGSLYDPWYTSHATTKKILSAVAGKNVKTINYFIADRNQLRGIYQRDIIGSNRYFESDSEDEKNVRKIRRTAKAEGVYVNDNKDCSGYDRQFIMVNDSRRLVAEVEELALPDNATTRQIGKAFSKFGDSKKKSRIVTQKFAEIVA